MKISKKTGNKTLLPANPISKYKQIEIEYLMEFEDAKSASLAKKLKTLRKLPAVKKMLSRRNKN